MHLVHIRSFVRCCKSSKNSLKEFPYKQYFAWMNLHKQNSVIHKHKHETKRHNSAPSSSSSYMSRCRHQDTAPSAHKYGVCWWCLLTSKLTVTFTAVDYGNERLLWRPTHASQCCEDKTHVLQDRSWGSHKPHNHMRQSNCGTSWGRIAMSFLQSNNRLQKISWLV